MQTTYSNDMPVGFDGQLTGIGDLEINSRRADEAIVFGRGLMRKHGDENSVRLPRGANVATITDDGGTFTAGSIATTVNGITVTTNWGTDKNTTMTAHAAAILANATLATILYSAAYSSGSHTITLKARNTDLTVTVSVAGVTGTMTISSIVNTSDDVLAMFVGIAAHSHVQQTSAGVAAYAANDAVNLLRKGSIFVIPEETVTSDDDVYLRLTTNSAKLPGMFGKSSDSSKCVQLVDARWRRGGTTSVPAILEINVP